MERKKKGEKEKWEGRQETSELADCVSLQMHAT